jgi:hypothetical protein
MEEGVYLGNRYIAKEIILKILEYSDKKAIINLYKTSNGFYNLINNLIQTQNGTSKIIYNIKIKLKTFWNNI